MMKRERFPFFHSLRVRYSEIDGQGIVFNAHYLTYFDTSITEYLRNVDDDYQRMVVERGLDFHIAKSTVEYLQPLRFDEVIDIGVAVGKVGTTSLTWALAIFRAGSEECVATGELIWVCSRVATHTSHPLPKDFVRSLSRLERS